jgi:hypothetical protein
MIRLIRAICQWAMTAMSLLTTGPRLRVGGWVSGILTLCMTELLKILPDYPPVLNQNCTSMINVRAYLQVSRRHVPTYYQCQAWSRYRTFFCYRRVRPRPVATETRLDTTRIIRCNSQPRHYGLQSSLRCDTP